MIVVNDNFKLASWADVLYAADPQWWDQFAGVPDFKGTRATQDLGTARKYGLAYIRSKRGIGFSKTWDYIHRGDNSGFQALNIAVLAKCDPIVLLGFDMKMNGKQRHWFGDHPGDRNVNSPYHTFATHFNDAALHAPNLNILNATRDTALKCWPKVELRTVI
jgi:hypothetical protein